MKGRPFVEVKTHQLRLIPTTGGLLTEKRRSVPILFAQWSPFVGLQVEYGVIERTPEGELMPMAQALNVGFTAWSK